MGGTITPKKAEYFSRVQELFKQDGGAAFFICGIDNVSSQQMHEIRKSIRGEGTVLMGKNSLIRKALRDLINEGDGQYDDLAKSLPSIVDNVGIVFINGGNDSTELLKTTREKIISNKVAAPAKAGAVSPKDVWVPAGPTGQDPSKTSFFQALGVPTKIARGAVEISTDFQVLEAGQKVGSSEAQLLNMLNISPFAYGMSVETVFANGQLFAASILDLEEETLVSHFVSAIHTIATISLAAGYPTLPMVSHSIINNYKNVLALSVATDYTFEGSETIKDRLANPEAYAAAAPAAAAASSGAADAPAAAEEEEEESDGDMGMGLFD